MIKPISFIVLSHFFQFNQLKILRQPGYFFKLNHQYGLKLRHTGLTLKLHKCFANKFLASWIYI